MKALTPSQGCESRCQLVTFTVWCKDCEAKMAPNGRHEGSHFEVLTLEFKRKLGNMEPLFDNQSESDHSQAKRFRDGNNGWLQWSSIVSFGMCHPQVRL